MQIQPSSLRPRDQDPSLLPQMQGSRPQSPPSDPGELIPAASLPDPALSVLVRGSVHSPPVLTWASETPAPPSKVTPAPALPRVLAGSAALRPGAGRRRGRGWGFLVKRLQNRVPNTEKEVRGPLPPVRVTPPPAFWKVRRRGPQTWISSVGISPSPEPRTPKPHILSLRIFKQVS